jgi:hypothetical protein
MGSNNNISDIIKFSMKSYLITMTSLIALTFIFTPLDI